MRIKSHQEHKMTFTLLTSCGGGAAAPLVDITSFPFSFLCNISRLEDLYVFINVGS